MRSFTALLAGLAALLAAASPARAQAVLYQTPFDDAAGWTLTPGTCTWKVDATPHILGGPVLSPPSSLNCNSDLSGTGGGYQGCFNRNADSPPIDLSPAAGVGAALSFWCNQDMEEYCSFDNRYVRVSNDGFQSLLLSICFEDFHCSSTGTWHEHHLSLDPAWGVVQVRFHFDTVDGDICNWCQPGWFIDDMAVTVDCAPVQHYCHPKVNSLVCVPVLSTIGVPSFSGAGFLRVLAHQVVSHEAGMLIWSLGQASMPFAGGTLCIAPPVIRTFGQTAGGSPPPPDCSGSYAFTWSPAYYAANGLTPGTPINAQYWSRDSGFQGPNGFGLTAAVRFAVCP